MNKKRAKTGTVYYMPVELHLGDRVCIREGPQAGHHGEVTYIGVRYGEKRVLPVTVLLDPGSPPFGPSIRKFVTVATNVQKVGGLF